MQKAYIPYVGAIIFSALVAATPVQAQTFTPTHHRALTADGPNQGVEAYTLIQRAFGQKSMEAPDLYPSNHTETPHIIEAIDEVVGPHFIFLAHRDIDEDRDKGPTDRQRNEIKAYDKSDSKILAYEGDVMQYRWKFKIDNDFEFSKSFTHFFQIKAKNSSREKVKNGGDSYPVITVSGVDKGAKGNEFQLRYSPGLRADGGKASSQKLIREDMSRFTGQWIEFTLQIDFRESGKLHFQAKNLETGERLAAYKSDDIDMWRGETKRDFSRPKWGIYRSLKDKESLRSTEEKARFADLSITKGTLKN